jgi:hypothetical protein
LKLSDVSGPIVRDELLNRVAVDGQRLFVVFRAVGFDEVLGQQRNVFASRAQRRAGERDHVEPVL